MAFVNATPVTNSRAATTLRPHVTPFPQAGPAHNVPTTVRMGYGDYSYSTDKTTGQVNKTFVNLLGTDSARVKGLAAYADESVVGGSRKGGGSRVPKDGIPQLENSSVLPVNIEAPQDPRIAETEGAVYPWDPNYRDPNESAYSGDKDEEEVGTEAMGEFRKLMSQERNAALSAMKAGASARVERIKGGLDENYLMTFDGQLDLSYARSEKISDPPFLTTTGQPQTEIPGFEYLQSVGALDFQDSDQLPFSKDAAAQRKASLQGLPEGLAPKLPGQA